MKHQADIIQAIARTSSRKDKEELLKNVDQKILYYTYHPHKRYFITAGKHQPDFTGSNNISSDTWRVLDILSTGQCRGAKAKALYQAYTNSLNPKSRWLFDKILNKDLKCGVNTKTVNKVYPSLVPDEFCMLATDYDADKVSYPCFVSIKIDGDRATFWPNKGLYSRRGKKISGLEHLERKYQRIPAPVDMELRDPMLSTSKSSGLVRSDREKPNIKAFIFDSHIDTDLPFFKRKALTNSMFRGIDPRIIVLPHFKCDSDVQMRMIYERAVEHGHEGIVINKYDHMYQFKRSSDWMRMVPIKTADVLVLDIVEGTGKYEDKMGAVKVEFNGLIQQVGSGFSDTERKLYYDEPENIIGKTIEVEYKGLTDYGKMRQPRHKRIRYDK